MANNIKQVMDIRPGKGMTTGQSDEHQRNWTERGWEWASKHGNYDRTRERLNFEVIKGGKVVPVDKSKSIPDRMAETLRERSIKDPNAGLTEPKFRTVANIIFGGSRERMHEIAFGGQKVNLTHGADNSHIRRNKDIELWAQDVYRFACDKWGEDNVIGFYVHLDELNPHVHCTVIPVDERNKISFNKIFGGNIYDFKERLFALHDELAKVNGKWGLNRGDSVSVTGTKHRTTEEYRRALSRECTALEKQIGNDRELLRQLHSDIRLAEKRVKGLSTMIANQEQKKLELEEEIRTVATDLRTGKGDSEELQKRIAKLDYELQKVLENLSDKREKLAEAMVGDIIREFRTHFQSLGKEAQSVFDDSLIKDMAERGEDIFKCAIYLFANYVDLATTFAEGHGGGGGGSDLPWRRKEDEDDRTWARRCLQRAHRMMKPAGGKSVRKK